MLWQWCFLLEMASSSRIRHTAHVVQKWFKEHNEGFRVLLWLPNSPIQYYICEMCYRSTVAPPLPQDTFKCLVKSMPQRDRAFWEHIRQVVKVFWLISVYNLYSIHTSSYSFTVIYLLCLSVFQKVYCELLTWKCLPPCGIWTYPYCLVWESPFCLVWAHDNS